MKIIFVRRKKHLSNKDDHQLNDLTDEKRNFSFSLIISIFIVIDMVKMTTSENCRHKYFFDEHNHLLKKKKKKKKKCLKRNFRREESQGMKKHI